MNTFAQQFSLIEAIKDNQERNDALTKLIVQCQKDEISYSEADVATLFRLQGAITITAKCTGLNIAILGYAVPAMGRWDPSNIKRGLPGSEECVVYASQELANQGHNVTVYMSPPQRSLWALMLSPVVWCDHEMWTLLPAYLKYDLVLMWRRPDLATGRKHGHIVFYWSHDCEIVTSKPIELFDGCIVLSQSHQKQLCSYAGYDKIPYKICGNGFLSEQFDDKRSCDNKLSIGYFSNYARGLHLLLMQWPRIRHFFPSATLTICYGRETWGTIPDTLLHKMITMIENNKDNGVIEMGKIGHQQLAKVMMSTSIWAYPCITVGETFCITAVKCQAAGCIPVTTRIAALDETVHPEAPSVNKIASDLEYERYIVLLLNTMNRVAISDNKVIKEERRKYAQWAQQFTWQKTVEKWLAFYKERVSVVKNEQQKDEKTVSLPQI